MKKTLLIILAAAFCFSLAAQPKSFQDLKSQLRESKLATKQVFGGNDANVSFAPSVRPSEHFPSSNPMQGIDNVYKIGETYYFLTSNANMRNTIDWSPDGKTCAATWTMGSNPTIGGSYLGNKIGWRGTGINYYDKAKDEWGPIPSLERPLARIETGSMDSAATKGYAPGWGTHVFTAKGECVLAHCTAEAGGLGAMLVNRREIAGQGEWIQSYIQGPVLTCDTIGQHASESTAILWPAVTSVGNTIHMVCVTENDTLCIYNPTGIDYCAPLYYRSKDGGVTWDEPFDFVDKVTNEYIMPLEDMERVNADDYTVTARGNHVVILYHCMYGLKVCYLESFDGGDTWERKVVYDAEFNWESTGVGVGPAFMPTNAAVAIGDDGVVHVAYAGQLICRTPDAKPHYYALFNSLMSGLFTWNSNKAPMKLEDFGMEYNFSAPTNVNPWVSSTYEEEPWFLYAPAILDTTEFYSENMTLKMFVANYDNQGIVEHPRLIAENGKVYLMYSAILQEPFLHPNDGRFMRGVFVTVSFDNGETFVQNGNTSMISYANDLFFCDWDAYNPFDPESIPEVVAVSENGYPSMAPKIVDGKIVFTWLNDLFQFPEWPSDNKSPDPWVKEAPFSVYSVIIQADRLGTDNYANTLNLMNPFKIKEQAIKNLKMYPNPATDNVRVTLDDTFTVIVSNMMGQVVQTMQGQGEVNFSVSNYPSGIYIVNVRTAQATTSQKLIVK